VTPSPRSEKRLVPISRQITRVFALLVIFTNVLLGLLLFFQFERQLTVAWIDRYHVPLDNLAKEIEYGLQLGFSLDTMENLPQLLDSTTHRYPELTSLLVVDRRGVPVAHTQGHLGRPPALGSLLAGIGNGEVNGLSVTGAEGQRFLVWSVKNPFGDTEGFVLMALPWGDLRGLVAQGRERLVLGIAALLGVGLLLSLGLFRLLCRDLEVSLGTMDRCADALLAGQRCIPRLRGSGQMESAFMELASRLGQLEPVADGAGPPQPRPGRIGRINFRARILAGALLLLLGSCVASTTVGYLIFRDIYLPVLYSQSRIIGQSLGELVSEMRAHGIPVARMEGMGRIFADLLVGFPQIAAIGLYDAQGRRLHARRCCRPRAWMTRRR
jgi:hypothetical protein